ncbi:MAG: hypothetical protein Q7I93_05405, partial [Syntrophales bacterium]|nr:hypothetical protein [Syntrophales bacterium]
FSCFVVPEITGMGVSQSRTQTGTSLDFSNGLSYIIEKAAKKGNQQCLFTNSSVKNAIMSLKPCLFP